MVADKIARICWNSNHWVTPSGREGKSLNEESYEYITGFGHEEWNFGTEKLIDGYVYGFLQQFNTKSPIHVGKRYNIHLYSIQKIKSNENVKWWLGKVNSIEVISKEESKRICSIYKSNGWYHKMMSDLQINNVDTKAFTETDPEILVNIRYKVKDIELLDSPVEMVPNDPAIPSFYYNLLNFSQAPVLSGANDDGFVFRAGHNPGKTRTFARRLAAVEGKSLLHNEIQTKIFHILEKKYGRGNVGSENKVGYESKIDLVAKDNDSFIYYEIKISPTAKSAIREAFGQIIEYCCWPDRNNATKMIVISIQPATKQVTTYLNHIRKKFQIPIYYQQYELETNDLKNIT
jgi:hypothetical protein